MHQHGQNAKRDDMTYLHNSHGSRQLDLNNAKWSRWVITFTELSNHPVPWLSSSYQACNAARYCLSLSTSKSPFGSSWHSI